MCIACCSIIRTINLSEPPLVLISSDNRSSTVYDKIFTLRNQHLQRNLFKGLWLSTSGASTTPINSKINHAAYQLILKYMSV